LSGARAPPRHPHAPPLARASETRPPHAPPRLLPSEPRAGSPRQARPHRSRRRQRGPGRVRCRQLPRVALLFRGGGSPARDRAARDRPSFPERLPCGRAVGARSRGAPLVPGRAAGRQAGAQVRDPPAPRTRTEAAANAEPGRAEPPARLSTGGASPPRGARGGSSMSPASRSLPPAERLPRDREARGILAALRSRRSEIGIGFILLGFIVLPSGILGLLSWRAVQRERSYSEVRLRESHRRYARLAAHEIDVELEGIESRWQAALD